MSRLEWIVCERSGSWATALCAALGRAGWSQSALPRIYEVRQLEEMTERLDMRPDAVALVEVLRTDFGDVLDWLAEIHRQHREACFVALMDGGVWGSKRRGAVSRQRDRQTVVQALREAGAADVVTFPRQLAGLLELGRRHASLRREAFGGLTPGTSIAEWAWSSLPWQEE